MVSMLELTFAIITLAPYSQSVQYHRLFASFSRVIFLSREAHSTKLKRYTEIHAPP